MMRGSGLREGGCRGQGMGGVRYKTGSSVGVVWVGEGSEGDFGGVGGVYGGV